ncbi:Adenylate/guanylate cyclase OS=Tsukamurella paurometabola (strain ATCC 8368 / DSM / CCUG 35730/ CIP 100753 / JCM 10117 / KCTC 9821 / NBRC 16120 / NCIMB 702349 / NCTC 13040) OX=521096 GN=Tpau_2734 PE=4 SV=1 [Tsukamurella paurometabola]|uniref:Adenylate/guanylate cyclase n=1 Tax=Tsukamurella paurometabola (strain ATCC 8368 / DSM 20162 / CCUG 35730 / CIP 100753 / JCM 10117 / KCTC 9821 / NBRC 16120 / NCIMB 702349 / NCTC 13040) TaxID=521096 RepID=D5USR1_TSUPD|nr:adenylate/guanylate cyclase domain-containing protein [Tsukamurella paurometabola]ADG79332.1 adenylate/guanylate cyclase [Tsukamurella paurometabola DSM 20162]SUP35123.1 Predicted transmembrane sensor domain [Tsukamurella paurometabola]
MADDALDVPAHDSGDAAPEPKKSVFAAGARAAHAANHSKTVAGIVRVARENLPGGPKKDLFHPDAESTERLSNLIDRIVGDEPTVTRELGNLATATWQALISRRDRDYLPPRPVTIMFTDLVSFSTWALHRDDDDIVRLLHAVNKTTKDLVERHGGVIVKTMGDGALAAFDGDTAIEAAYEVIEAVGMIDVADGYRPTLRAGLHTGTPRQVKGDLIGVDVNIAARVAEAANGGEVLASETVFTVAERDRYQVRPRRFKAKGAPQKLQVFSVRPLY